MTDKKGNGAEVSDLYETWVDFTALMGEQLEKLGKEGASKYADALRTWTEYHRTVNDQLMGYLKDQERARQAAEIMDSHANRMKQIIDACAAGNEKACTEDVSEAWSAYSANVGKMVTEIIDASITEQKELYELWMDSTGRTSSASGGAPGSGGMAVADMWNPMAAFPSLMRALSPPAGLPAGATGPMEYVNALKEAQDRWSKEYSTMMRDLMMTPAFARWSGDTVSRAMDAKMQMDKMTTTYLRSMGLPTRSDIDGLRERLTGIERQLREMSESEDGGRRARGTPTGKGR